MSMSSCLLSLTARSMHWIVGNNLEGYRIIHLGAMQGYIQNELADGTGLTLRTIQRTESRGFSLAGPNLTILSKFLTLTKISLVQLRVKHIIASIETTI